MDCVVAVGVGVDGVFSARESRDLTHGGSVYYP